jgi:hypothetical protein
VLSVTINSSTSSSDDTPEPLRPGPSRVIGRLILLGLPLAAVLAFYAVSDPFKVLRRYHWGNYYDDQPYELNREYVSTEMLLANQPRQQFDSYIFGSSRSFPYHCGEWEKYLNGGRAFHYPAASETIFGVLHKLLFLERHHMPVRHALIIIDHTALATVTDRPDHLHRCHPEVSGEGWIRFESASLEAFFVSRFWLKYADYRISHQIRPYMKGMFEIRPGMVRIDPLTNDYSFVAEEEALATDPARFYQQRSPQFLPRSCQGVCYREPVVGEAQRQMLLAIRQTLDRLGSHFQVVVTPFYDQLDLHPKDQRILQEVFGTQRVHDFMGKNRFTETMTNYYDATHYRPTVANAIMAQVYAPAPEGMRPNN